MSEILQITLWQEAYYEASIDVSVIEDKGQKFKEWDYGSYYNIRNCKEFFKAFKEVVFECEDNFDISASNMYGLEKMFDTCDETHLQNIIENYKYLDELKSKSYTYSKNDKFNRVVFNNGDGYGGFRQQIIPFDNVELLIKSNEEFKKYCFNHLGKDLVKVASYGNEEVALKSARQNLTHQEKQLERVEKDIKTYKKNIKECKEIIKGLELND